MWSKILCAKKMKRDDRYSRGNVKKINDGNDKDDDLSYEEESRCHFQHFSGTTASRLSFKSSFDTFYNENTVENDSDLTLEEESAHQDQIHLV